MALAATAALLFMPTACKKLLGPGIFSMPPAGSTAEQCHLNSDGSQTCGYNCKLAANGTYACASTPEGTCSMEPGGEVVCTDPPGALASEPGPAPASPTPAPAPSPRPAPAQVDAKCCINGAYYSCPSAADVKICIGEPMRIMSCVDGCGFSSSCEQDCIAKHGPKPGDSACTRKPERDGDC